MPDDRGRGAGPGGRRTTIWRLDASGDRLRQVAAVVVNQSPIGAGLRVERGPDTDGLGDCDIAIESKFGRWRRCRVAWSRLDGEWLELGAEKVVDGNPKAGGEPSPEEEMEWIRLS